MALFSELKQRPTIEQEQFFHNVLRATETERNADILRKRSARSEAARITIPACVDPQRRERCLDDVELFLKTYFARRYKRKFGRLHYEMIDAFLEVAENGGKKAVAAPRGRGKTELVKGLLTFTICKGLLRFPVPIGQTTGHAQEIYEDFRDKCMHNDLLAEDFPEVCYPVRSLEGAPQRANKQHIDGNLTRIKWTTDRLRLADVPEAYRGPIDYGGVRMEYRGLDAAIRGINRSGDRPDCAVIDEPETAEAARSATQIANLVKAIDQDVAGLAGEDEELSQILLTTIQTAYSASAVFTDRDQRPSWLGVRLGWVEKWPDEWNKGGEEGEGLWYEYIAMRGEDQRQGDRYGRRATQFYLDNRKAMEAGGALLADNYKSKVLKDGWQVVHSAWQVVFNAIADTSYQAFCTEYQNQPPEKEQIDTIELTHGHVAACLSGLDRGEVPEGTVCLTRGIDIGKYESRWCLAAWDDDATGTVIDYGIIHTTGLDKFSSKQAIETSLINTLEHFAETQAEIELELKRNSPLLTLVDSGYMTTAIYEACRRLDGWYPAKGLDPFTKFRMPQPSDTKQLFLEAYASKQVDEFRREVWLYDINDKYWKNWVQERWLVQTFTDDIRTPGSLAVFDPPHGDIKYHTKWAKSQVSERWEHIPLPNKGFKAEWVVKDRYNNHDFDATALASAAAGCVGIRLIKPQVKAVPAKAPQAEPKPNPYSRNGRPFLVTER